MKIIYLHQYFTTPNMPGGTRSYEIARRLVQRGHEVYMITSLREDRDKAKRGWVETDEDGIHVYWIPIPYSNDMSYRDRIISFTKFATFASVKVARMQADVVFATSTPLTIALPGILVSRKNDIPMVFEVRDLWPELPIAIGALKNPVAKRVARLLERFAYNNSSYIIALSPGIKEGIASSGFPAERIVVIPNFSELGMFSMESAKGDELREKHEWLKDRPLVIYTGTIGLVNGVDYLVKLAVETNKIDKEVRFLIIGSGKEAEKVRCLAERLGVLGKNFFMMPSIPKNDVPGWLAAADISISVTIDLKELRNNSANKFFDALAAGKPIAINYGGWQADLIQNNDAGLVLDAMDIGSSAKLLVSALQDKDWLNRAGKNARRLAEECFNCDKLVAKLEEVIVMAVNDHIGAKQHKR